MLTMPVNVLSIVYKNDFSQSRIDFPTIALHVPIKQRTTILIEYSYGCWGMVQFSLSLFDRITDNPICPYRIKLFESEACIIN